MANTPHMDLALPTPGLTPGPTYAEQLNEALEQVDAHDHTTGRGQRVPTAGLHLDADLPFNEHSAVDLRSVRLADQSAVLGLPTDLSCLYARDGDLWWNNGAGTPVQITDGAGLNASAIGGIGGMDGTDASVTYRHGPGAFEFRQADREAASLDAGPVVIRDPAPDAYGVTVQSPAGLVEPYTLTLPAGLPGSTLPMVVSSAGAMSTSQIATSHVQNGAITRAKLAAVGQQVSGSSGTFTTSSASYVSVTNLSVALTTTGRPVLVMLVPAPGGSAFVRGADLNVALHVDGSHACEWTLNTDTTNIGLMFFVVPAAGAHTFAIRARSGAGAAFLYDLQLVAWEL